MVTLGTCLLFTLKVVRTWCKRVPLRANSPLGPSFAISVTWAAKYKGYGRGMPERVHPQPTSCNLAAAWSEVNKECSVVDANAQGEWLPLGM
jgi:hypothetical protein